MTRRCRILAALTILLVWPFLSHADQVQMNRSHGLYTVPVVINGLRGYEFIVDSGASIVSVPADKYEELLKSEVVLPSDLLDVGIFVLADGTRVESQRFVIRSMSVGNIDLPNVIAVVVPRGGALLLGQTFFSKLVGWSIDNGKGLLDLKADTSDPDSKLWKPIDAELAQARWVPQGDRDDDGTQLYVDAGNILVSGDRRQVRIKYGYIRPSEDPSSRGTSHWVRARIYWVELSCRHRTFMFVGQDTAVQDDGVITRRLPLLSNGPRRFESGSGVDSYFSFVCNWHE